MRNRQWWPQALLAFTILELSWASRVSLGLDKTLGEPLTGGARQLSAAVCSALYEQCGGLSWTGPTCCDVGSVCVTSSEWYSQCLPDPAVHTGQCSGRYEQCGGIGWAGPTCCDAGTSCQILDDYFHQCLPGSGGVCKNLRTYDQCAGPRGVFGNCIEPEDECFKKDAYYSQCRPRAEGAPSGWDGSKLYCYITTEPVTQKRCGASQADAQARCGGFCSIPTDPPCPAGTSCFSVPNVCPRTTLFASGAPSPAPSPSGAPAASRGPSSAAAPAPSSDPQPCTVPIFGKIAQHVNIVGTGLDVFRFNPLSTEKAPEQQRGFRLRVLNVGYFSDTPSCNGITLQNGLMEFAQPTGAQVQGGLSVCSEAMSTEVLNGTSSYVDTLKTHVNGGAEVDAKLFKGKFKASFDYQSIAKESQTANSIFASTTATCAAFTGLLDVGRPPSFDSGFVNSVEGLPDVYSDSTKDDYFKFFVDYGTHVVTGATFGLKRGLETKLKEAGVTRYASDKSAFEADANAHASIVSLNVGANSESMQEASNEYASLSTTRAFYKLGNLGVTGTDSDKWNLQQVLEDPYPLDVSIQRMPDFFIPKYGATPTMMARKGPLEQALAEFCHFYDSFGACDPPAPDPKSGLRNRQWQVTLANFVVESTSNDGSPKEEWRMSFSAGYDGDQQTKWKLKKNPPAKSREVRSYAVNREFILSEYASTATQCAPTRLLTPFVVHVSGYEEDTFSDDSLPSKTDTFIVDVNGLRLDGQAALTSLLNPGSGSLSTVSTAPVSDSDSHRYHLEYRIIMLDAPFLPVCT